MKKPETPKRTRAPGAGRPKKHATAGNTYTFRLAGPAEALLLLQQQGTRNAFVEAALLAYRPE